MPGSAVLLEPSPTIRTARSRRTRRASTRSTRTCWSGPSSRAVTPRLRSQGQGIFDDRSQVARFLGVGEERIFVELVPNGGGTLVYEMLVSGAPPLDDLVAQVGGGALASACMQAYARAVTAELLTHSPRVHTVQTRGASPLQRAWTLVEKRRASTGASAEDALRYAAAHRSGFMWPWEETPHSIAEGILDDETYDWAAVLRGMAATGGTTVVADEDTLKEANRVAREATGIAVSHTGSAGLAGVLQLRSEGVIATGARVGVLFSGARR